MGKLIYYYQTFSTLQPLIDNQLDNSYIYVSSIHFGSDSNNIPYIHLNDSPPSKQPNVWKDIKKANENGITIMIMLGGAGGAYNVLFSDFETYYNLLYKFLNRYTCIEGIDLDVEEYVDIKNIKKLIKRLKTDFGYNFIITMAPIAESLISDTPGLGGFIYKELYKSKEGLLIDWFNVQCYGSYTLSTYDKIIQNGYPPDKIVFGMLGDNYNKSNFPIVLKEIKSIVSKYDDMGGCCLWEYGDTTIDPILWGTKINNILNMYYCCCKIL
jgi:hypothetical protein